MADYEVPLRDIRFVRNEVLDFPGFYATLPQADIATTDVIYPVLEEMAKFCEEQLVPLYRSGDEEGCEWSDGEVSTPKGFKDCLLYTSPSPRDGLLSRMPSSA